MTVTVVLDEDVVTNEQILAALTKIEEALKMVGYRAGDQDMGPSEIKVWEA